MVASTNPVTSQVGLDVLRQGGNAVDAAIAMAAVHIVVEPGVGHLGGDTFMLVHLNRNNKTVALNGSGAAPRRATRSWYSARGGIPEKGPLAASIPGTVACWGDAAKEYGTQPLEQLLKPAITCAAKGFPVQNRLSRYLNRSAPIFRTFEGSRAQYLNNRGSAPRPGDLLIQPWLARTLERIAIEGADVFYKGEIANAIVDYWQTIGGLFELDDFKGHRTRIEEPLWSSYRGVGVLQQPLPSQGLLLLLMLNIIEHFPIAEWGAGSAKAIHHMIEAKKLAFEVRDRFLGDPEFQDVPISQLLDKAYAGELAAQIKANEARPVLSSASTISSDTDYFCVVDGERNIVSHIHSLFPGCGVTVPGVGAMFNSRMLSFSLDDDHPNALEPGKRPLHTLNSWMIAKDGHPVVVGGVTAGDLQVQFNLQILAHLLDDGQQLHEALDAPRWGIRSHSMVQIEAREQDRVLSELEHRGHEVERLAPWGATGRAHTIAIDYDRGILVGHSEMRDDGGFVLGY